MVRFKRFTVGSIPALLMAVAAMMTTFTAAAEPMSKEQGEAILKELRELRKIVESIDSKTQAGAKPKPKTASVPVKGGSRIGDPRAPLTLVEFTDYQCPYCERFFKLTFPELKKKYVDTGKVQIIVKDLPLNFHKYARKAAQASRCAGEQDKFLQMHEKLLSNGKRLQENYLYLFAREIGLNNEKFQSCLQSNRYLKQIDQDVQQALAQGITGTPTFVLGKTSTKIITGSRIVGALPFAKFEEQILEMLKK